MSDKAKTAGFASFARLDQRLKRLDEPRWLATRYLPSDERRILVTLYLLDLELARASKVSEPMLRLIRLQWWEDSLSAVAEGARGDQHEVLQALSAVLGDDRGGVGRVLPLVDAWKALVTGDDGARPPEVLLGLAAKCLENDVDARELQQAKALVSASEDKAAATRSVVIGAKLRPLVLHLAALGPDGTPYGGVRARWRVFLAALTGRLRLA